MPTLINIPFCVTPFLILTAVKMASMKLVSHLYSGILRNVSGKSGKKTVSLTKNYAVDSRLCSKGGALAFAFGTMYSLGTVNADDSKGWVVKGAGTMIISERLGVLPLSNLLAHLHLPTLILLTSAIHSLSNAFIPFPMHSFLFQCLHSLLIAFIPYSLHSFLALCIHF